MNKKISNVSVMTKSSSHKLLRLSRWAMSQQKTLELPIIYNVTKKAQSNNTER